MMKKFNGWLFHFLEQIDGQIKNENELLIARMVLLNINNLEELSLEKLAKLSYVSPASISRFIKKLGFDNYQSFRTKLNDSYSQLSYRRSAKQKEFDIIEYGDHLIECIEIFKTVDMNHLRKLIDMMIDSNSVTFLGSYYSLGAFYTVQLDLIAKGIPCFLFQREENNIHMPLLKKDDLVVILSASGGFFHSLDLEKIKEYKEKGVKLAIIYQQTINNLELFDYAINIPHEDILEFNKIYSVLLSRIITNLLLEKE